MDDIKEVKLSATKETQPTPAPPTTPESSMSEEELILAETMESVNVAVHKGSETADATLLSDTNFSKNKTFLSVTLYIE